MKKHITMVMAFGLILLIPSVSGLVLDRDFVENFIEWEIWGMDLNYTNNTAYLGGHLPSHYLGGANNTVYFGGHLPSYYAAAANVLRWDDLTPVFVNRSGDNMSGDLNITRGSGFINLSADGNVAISGHVNIGGEYHIADDVILEVRKTINADDSTAIIGQPKISGPHTNAYGIWFQMDFENAAADLTNSYSNYIADPAYIIGADITNNYGLYIENMRRGDTSNYGIYSAGGDIYFAGDVGVGINSPDSILHIKANTPGTVGSHPAGQLIIQDPDDTVFGNVVITAYESDGAGNPDQQLWYLGSSSGSNTDIIFLNRRNANLQLGTNGVSRLTILGNGNVGIGDSSPAQLLTVQGNGVFYSGTGYVNITAATGLINMSGSLTINGHINMNSTSPRIFSADGGTMLGIQNNLFFFRVTKTGAGATGNIYFDAAKKVIFRSSLQAFAIRMQLDILTGALNITGNLSIETPGQSGITMRDQAGNLRCMVCWSDGICNATKGSC